MAASPQFKVYDAQGIYQAACKEAEAAGAVASLYGNGATIRWNHRDVLWTEGQDGAAHDSYDLVADRVAQRQDEIRAEIATKRMAQIERSRQRAAETRGRFVQ